MLDVVVHRPWRRRRHEAFDLSRLYFCGARKSQAVEFLVCPRPFRGHLGTLPWTGRQLALTLHALPRRWKQPA